jgi:hypothetical protein
MPSDRDIYKETTGIPSSVANAGRSAGNYLNGLMGGISKSGGNQISPGGNPSGSSGASGGGAPGGFGGGGFPSGGGLGGGGQQPRSAGGQQGGTGMGSSAQQPTYYYNGQPTTQVGQELAVARWNQIQDMLRQMQDARTQGIAKNEERYNQILGYGDPTGLGGLIGVRGRAMGYLDTLSNTERSDINQQYNNAGTQARASLAAKGLGNTTIVPTAISGIERQRSQSLGALNDRLVNQRMTADSNLSNNIYGFMERRTDSYPSLESIASISAGAAAGVTPPPPAPTYASPQQGYSGGSGGQGAVMGYSGLPFGALTQMGYNQQANAADYFNQMGLASLYGQQAQYAAYANSPYNSPYYN